MTGLVGLTFEDLPGGFLGARVTLQGPRSNALTPEGLAALSDALDTAEDAGAALVTLAASGHNFCSGGDVARFADRVASGQGAAYASQVVPRLQQVILRLVSMPALIGLAGRGAITGGGAGFLFAADLAVLAPDAFVQPYYTTVGFAPDGGWSALLPEIVGAGAALSMQLANRRISAAECVRLGLAIEIDPAPEQRLNALVSVMNIDAARAAKRLVWDAERLRSVAVRLEAEVQAFFDRIAQPDTEQGMSRFLQGLHNA
jgi:2-(1,2-epoxy-1,2-dihydrophenyl)acetyl-CoA isomerase